MQKFPEALTELMKSDPGKTQAEWARCFGINRVFVSRVLSGHETPGRTTVAGIVRYFGERKCRPLLRAYLVAEYMATVGREPENRAAAAPQPRPADFRRVINLFSDMRAPPHEEAPKGRMRDLFYEVAKS